MIEVADWRAEVAPGHVRSDDGTLHIGGVSAADLAALYGTPVLALDLTVFDRAIDSLVAACADPGIEIAYAGKALIFTALARHLRATPLKLDVCSLGELVTAEAGGFPAERICVHGSGKTDELLQAIADGRAAVAVVDDIEELRRLARFAQPARPVKVVLRVNAGIEAHTHAFIHTNGEDTKFGIDTRAFEEALRALLAAPGLRYAGLHSHIGSQIVDPEPFLANADALMEFAARAKRLDADTPAIIVGGGFGVETHPAQPVEFDMRALFQGIALRVTDAARRSRIPTPNIGIEPGRAIAARAGTSLYRVKAVKTHGRRRFVVVDGGLGDNPRPALYNAYHHPLVACSKASGPLEAATIAGRSCENDELVEAQLPADLAPGDLLALTTTGAYTYTMANNYNRFGRPPVVALREGRHALAVRGETPDDVLRNDVRDAVFP